MSAHRTTTPKRRRFTISAVAFGLLLALSLPVLAGTTSGSASDPSYPALGEIDYLFNKAGYHFWFTPTSDVGPYEAGHSYHNVYKYEVGDASDWCGPVGIPDRLPYNADDTDGMTAYYKIWDVTDGAWVCGSD